MLQSEDKKQILNDRSSKLLLYKLLLYISCLSTFLTNQQYNKPNFQIISKNT